MINQVTYLICHKILGKTTNVRCDLRRRNFYPMGIIKDLSLEVDLRRLPQRKGENNGVKPSHERLGLRIASVTCCPTALRCVPWGNAVRLGVPPWAATVSARKFRRPFFFPRKVSR